MSLLKGGIWTQRQRQGETRVKIGIMLPQAKESQRLPANQQKLGEKHGTDSSS